MRKKISLNQILLIALFVSLLVHVAPVSYLVLSPPSLKHKQNIEVEILSGSPESKSPIAQAPLVSKQVTSQSSRALPSVPHETAIRNILSGGFQQHQFDRLLSDDGSVEVSSNGATTSGEQTEAFPADPMTNVKEFGHGWSGAVQYGNSMGLKFTLESLPFFQALHARINSQLIYPDDFSRQRIAGRVRIEAELGRDGKLIRFISSQADDRLLQTYCFAVLVQILSQPLPERMWLATDRTFVAFDFDFFARVKGNNPRTLVATVEKNRLSFSRENEVNPWLNERVTEILTHYIPPIIPIPGGFYIDLVMAYEYVNNLMNDAPTEREVRGERLSKLHEVLRQILKQANIVPAASPIPEPNS